MPGWDPVRESSARSSQRGTAESEEERIRRVHEMMDGLSQGSVSRSGENAGAASLQDAASESVDWDTLWLRVVVAVGTFNEAWDEWGSQWELACFGVAQASRAFIKLLEEGEEVGG
jgi:hypothetical protein